jgi:hypothetical protein
MWPGPEYEDVWIGRWHRRRPIRPRRHWKLDAVMTIATCGAWLVWMYVRMLGRHTTRIG